MYFKQFSKKLSEQTYAEVEAQLRSYGHLIEQTTDGVILIDQTETEFNSLEEARHWIIQQYNNNKLVENIANEVYELLDDNKIATIIKEQHDVKVTDTLIESYKELASSKMFTIDPVVTQIRSLNKLDKLVEGKIDYKLDDGTVVAIDEETQDRINNLLQNHKDVVELMRESKENFLSVIRKLEE